MNTCTELRTGPGFLMSLQPGGMDHIQMLTSILNFSLTVTPTPSQGQPVTLLTHTYASALPWKPVPSCPHADKSHPPASSRPGCPPLLALCGHIGLLTRHCHSLGLPEAFLPPGGAATPAARPPSPAHLLGTCSDARNLQSPPGVPTARGAHPVSAVS